MNAFNAGFAAGFLVAPVLLTWMAGWQRRGAFFFGVRVEQGFGASEPAKNIRRSFQWQQWILAALVIAILLVPRTQQKNVWFLIAAMGMYTLGLVAIYAGTWKKAKVYASNAPLVRSTTLRQMQTSVAPGTRMAMRALALLGFLVPLCMIIAAAFVVNAHAHQVPARFPVRWSHDGTPTVWSSDTLRNLYGNLFAAGAVYLGDIFLFFAIQYRSRISDWGISPGISRYYRLAMLGWSMLVSLILIAMLCIDALVPIYGNHPLPWSHLDALTVRTIAVGAVDIVLFAMIGLAYWARKRYGQLDDMTPDSCWKLGQFYINRNDPALVVPKRCGLGYSLNFGHGVTWVYIVLMVVMFMAPFCIGR